MHAIFAAIALTILSLWLSPAAEARAVRSLHEMRTERVFVQDWDLSCGAAALATVLKYQHGLNVTEREVAIGLMNRPEYLANPTIVRVREGFSLLDMQRYANGLGLDSEGFGRLTLEELIPMAPAIVPLNRNGYNHFVVFRGLVRGRVLVSDPSFGARTMTLDQFERRWMVHPKLGRIAFVVRGAKTATVAAGPGLLAPRAEEFFTFA